MTDNRCITSLEQKTELDFWRNVMRLNTSIPGIINAFDPQTQKVSATPAINAKYVSPDGKVSYIQYPMITNIPLAISRGAGMSFTQPITVGYPCTLIFSQRSIDNFVEEGTYSNPVEGPNPRTSSIRCMDLTDAMCFPGVITQADKISGYSTDAFELRSDDGKVKVSVKANSLTLKQDSATIEMIGGNITMSAATINVTGTEAINITSPATVIDGKPFLGHQHSGVSTGGSNTGGVA